MLEETLSKYGQEILPSGMRRQHRVGKPVVAVIMSRGQKEALVRHLGVLPKNMPHDTTSSKLDMVQ